VSNAQPVFRAEWPDEVVVYAGARVGFVGGVITEGRWLDLAAHAKREAALEKAAALMDALEVTLPDFPATRIRGSSLYKDLRAALKELQ